MNIKNFSFPVFSFQFNLNNTVVLVTNKIKPSIITNIDKIIKRFIKIFDDNLISIYI